MSSGPAARTTRQTLIGNIAPSWPGPFVANVLVDASALVALLDRDDRAHDACVRALSGIRQGSTTVWPAFTEAMYLLSDYPRAVEALFEMVEDGLVALANLDESREPWHEGTHAQVPRHADGLR